MQVVKPTWYYFDRLVSEAKSVLVICSPWISAVGLEHLQLLLKEGTSLKRLLILARMADVNTDAPGILQLVKQLALAGIETKIYDSPVLHAKFYFADDRVALVTSANLSDGGFSVNLEAGVLFSEPEGIAQVAKVLEEIMKATTPVSVADLEHFVVNERPAIVDQSPPQSPPATVPVWRRQAEQAVSKTEPNGVSFTDLVEWAKSSLQSAQTEIEDIELKDWIGKKVVIWTCPCYVVDGGVSQYLFHQLAEPYTSRTLEAGARLLPEMFTKMVGSIESLADKGRTIFRPKGARTTRIELTRYPDPGSGSILHPSKHESHFLLKIQEA